MIAIDWIVVGLYFLVVLALAWWVILKNKETSADYFLASHSLGWFVVGASIFASNIGSWFVPGVVCAALYLALSLPVSHLARRLERTWRRT